MHRVKRVKRLGIKVGVGAAAVVLGLFAVGAIDRVLVRPHHKVPMTQEVEESIERNASDRGGPVKDVSCQAVARNVWGCIVRYVDGRLITGKATWYPNARELNIALNFPSNAAKR
jgi:hypothetical protein